MSTVMVCGSVALDLIGRYSGSFHDYQAKFPVTGLNISLQLAQLRTSFGGCGLNIAYGLHQLGIKVLPVSAAGRNFDDHYRQHLQALGMDISNIIIDPDYAQCASAVLISDEQGNQITAFHAGAAVSPRRPLPSTIQGIETVTLAVLAPEDAPIMLRQARDLAQLGIPIMFDPGQGLTEFVQADLAELLNLCRYLIVNSHEWQILQHNAGMDAATILAGNHQVIVTHGAEGVDIYGANGIPTRIQAVASDCAIDSTGCGDAFRAGYIYGLLGGWSPEICARLGCLTAVYNLESDQTQRYHISHEAFVQRYEQAFDRRFPA
jgi:adenosine kinase